MDNWQLISTAPKDETEVLVFLPNLGTDAQHWWCLSEDSSKFPASSGRMIARFFNGEWVSPMCDGRGCDECGCQSLDISPSHWMPLPAPPDISPGVEQAVGDGTR